MLSVCLYVCVSPPPYELLNARMFRWGTFVEVTFLAFKYRYRDISAGINVKISKYAE
jgi:hypothetical protein